MLHVVRLAADQAAQVQDHALGFVPLAQDRDVGVLERAELFLVALAFALELLGDFLLQDERFEGVVSLLFGAGEACCDACCVVLLLVDEACETSVFALVSLDLDLEVLGLLRELFGECLELEELSGMLVSLVYCLKPSILPVVSSSRVLQRGSYSVW